MELTKGQKTMARIVEAAVQLAKKKDYTRLTKREVADRAKVSPGLIGFYFGDLQTLHDHIVEQAVDRGIAVIVARAMLDGHSATVFASTKLRRDVTKLFREV